MRLIFIVLGNLPKIFYRFCEAVGKGDARFPSKKFLGEGDVGLALPFENRGNRTSCSPNVHGTITLPSVAKIGANRFCIATTCRTFSG